MLRDHVIVICFFLVEDATSLQVSGLCRGAHDRNSSHTLIDETLLQLVRDVKGLSVVKTKTTIFLAAWGPE
jgi:hypothetical protein